MGHTPEEINKHVKAYILVFGALIVLTFATVGASYLKVSHGLGLFIGLLIATVKGSLVATVFMHLKEEKGLIYLTLILKAIFTAAMMGLILWMHWDVPTVS